MKKLLLCVVFVLSGCATHPDYYKQRNVPVYNIDREAKVPDDIIMPIDLRLYIDVDNTGMIERQRYSDYPERLTWVIRRNGETVLERNADNELRYRYFGNAVPGKYTVFVKLFTGTQYVLASNVVTYETK